jgi:hypothetical protein
MAIGPARSYHGIAMDPLVPHRKRVRHYDLPGHAHELTFSCYRRLPLLVDDSTREELARTIDRAVSRHGWHLSAFVFMPEHVHLVVLPAIPCATATSPDACATAGSSSSALLPNDPSDSSISIPGSGATAGLPSSASPQEIPSDTPRISDLLFAIKRPFSFQMKQRLQAAASPLMGTLTIRQRPGVTTFRFWQEGPLLRPQSDDSGGVPSLARLRASQSRSPRSRRACSGLPVEQRTLVRVGRTRHGRRSPSADASSGGLDPTRQPRRGDVEAFRRCYSHCWTSQQWHPTSAAGLRRSNCKFGHRYRRLHQRRHALLE